MKVKPGDKILLMSYEEAREYAENDPNMREAFQGDDIIGIGRDEYNKIVSRGPHTVAFGHENGFYLKDEPYIYEPWLIKRKNYIDICLNDNLFKLE